ncbi:hypothetical protein CWI38_0118p0040 [Hamiltosporidium tvaerminnensis]|uniref:Uncharacterized protein n=1 Tax=Hamiltosporidium tvaerminnensis TaxID=1176355 RepID=A0A4Q9LW34_9MICR|nr:hypothetical protein CWI38_0579p0020 [Hamiltosporidium tvaerminnensis]TBU20179.1 hypothetical protein CWI38_0118p0040 [Hamiltosporidium tvaerminnensis]
MQDKGNTRIKTYIKIRNNRPDILILDKIETEKLRKYDLLANGFGLIFMFTVLCQNNISNTPKRLEIPDNLEA